MLRSDESKVIERALNSENNLEKEASYFERISFGSPKKDPFEGEVSGDIWKIQGNKILKRKNNKETF